MSGNPSDRGAAPLGTPPAGAALSPGARKVQEALAARGLAHRVFELDVPVRTAAEAAAQVGCEVAQIAKSIVFRAAHSGRAVLVITSGANRVDEARITALLGEPLEKADAGFVRTATGFPIGGIPPLGHATEPVSFVDEDLLRFETIWAAAGHPNALFALSPHDLPRMVAGPVVKVTA
jgi:prolyl-tRNA editing enzyme YbaK/EbsC (Cys-tRNA(Pro) deacylase)